MSFSHRHSTGPNCWGDDQVQEANHPPVTAFSYWNEFCNVKSCGRVEKCWETEKELSPKNKTSKGCIKNKHFSLHRPSLRIN